MQATIQLFRGNMSVALKEYVPVKEPIMFDPEIRFNPKLTAGEKIFLAELKNMSKEGSFPYSAKNLSGIFHVSRPTIISWVKKLGSMGLLEVYLDSNLKQHLRIKD